MMMFRINPEYLLQVFNTELEKAIADFHEFDDFCHAFTLNRGKNIEDEDSSQVGEFKVILVKPLSYMGFED